MAKKFPLQKEVPQEDEEGSGEKEIRGEIFA